MNPSPHHARFHSAHVRARIVKILLLAGAVISGIALVAEALTLVFPPLTDDQEFADNPAGAALVFVLLFLALLEIVIYLLTIVFFCMWLYRAYGNLRAFAVWQRLDNSPGWAVGSFFVPFMNLVVPYRAVKEVWQKSEPPAEGLLSAPKAPVWFPMWWLFWLLASFAGNASFRASFNENIPESTATVISVVAGGLSIVAAIFAYLVVDAIDTKQEETSAKLRLGKFAVPPAPHVLMPDVVTNSPQQIS
jgi:hypothetical protein